MRKYFDLIFFFFYALLLGAKEKEIELYHKFHKGMELCYEVTSIVKSVSIIGEEKDSSITKTKILMKEKVEDIRGDTAILVFKVEDISGKVQRMGREISLEELQDFKGSEIKVYYCNGKIIDAEGQMKEKFMQTLNTSYQFLPEDRKVSIGESWKREVITPDRKEKCLYTLTGIETIKGYRCAKINFTIKIEEKSKREWMGIPVGIEMQGEGDGVIYFAIKEGRLVGYEGNLNVSGTITTFVLETKILSHISSKVKLLD